MINVGYRLFCRTFFLTARAQENNRSTQGPKNHLLCHRKRCGKKFVIRPLSGGLPAQGIRKGGDHQQDKENDEKDFGHPNGSTSKAREAKKPRDQGEDQECDGPVEHDRCWLIRDLSSQKVGQFSAIDFN
jgi:hypothetical protein